VLFVRVDRDGVGAVDADVVQPVDRIVTGAAGTDDDNPGVPELVVVHADVHVALFRFRIVEGVLNEILHQFTPSPSCGCGCARRARRPVRSTCRGQPTGSPRSGSGTRPSLDHLFDLVYLLFRYS